MNAPRHKSRTSVTSIDEADKSFTANALQKFHGSKLMVISLSFCIISHFCHAPFPRAGSGNYSGGNLLI